MRIKVDFTISVETEDLEELRTLAEAGDNREAISYVKAQAQNDLLMYLEDNGIRVRVVRDSALTY